MTKPVWSKKTPTAIGCYWIVFPLADIQLNIIPAQIYQGPESLLLAFPGDEKITTPDRYEGCLWYGPIPKPQKPEISMEQFKNLSSDETIDVSF